MAGRLYPFQTFSEPGPIVADTSKPRARRRPSSSASTGGKGRTTAAKGKPKPKARTSAKTKGAGAKPRKPAASRRGASTAGKGRAMPGLSLRTLVLGSVAAALVVVGAAIGVTVDKAMRDDPVTPEPARAAAPAVTPPSATTAAPAPASRPTPPPAPTKAADAAPTAPAPAAISPPKALTSTEAVDYAHAANEYKEVPPSYPPQAGTTDEGAAPAPRTKPPVPRDTQIAALPTPPKSVLSPAPQQFSGQPPWQRYAVASPAINGRPMIAIVIDDLGVDKRRSSKIVELDGPLTTAWMTYADNVDAQARKAREAGHELIIHMPMEPLNSKIDSGPDVLRTTMTPEQVRAQVRAGLKRFEGYVGINNHMGSKFTADPKGMAVVIDEMRANGLLFLDSKTSPRSVGTKLAAEAGIPHAERHVFIDNVDEVGAVLKQLREVEEIARRTGYAIAIGHPHDGTFGALKQWLPSLKDKGLVLVPLSTIVRERMGRG